MRNGVDVSPYQHPRDVAIDWQLVANHGYRWAAVKLNEGMGDPYGDDIADVGAARAVGVDVAAYHFARPTTCDPVASARKFAAICDEHAPGADRVLDLEDGAALGWPALHAWYTAFQAAGRCDVLYVNQSYRDGLDGHGGRLGERLWLAVPGAPTLGDGEWARQFGQGGVPGIPVAVDLNIVADKVTPTPNPTGEDDMDDYGAVQAVAVLYDIRGNTDKDGMLDWCQKVLAAPRDGRGIILAELAKELRG